MQSLLECGICLDNFNSSERKPVVLPCGHTVCQQCVGQMCKSADKVQCPFCKKKHKTKVQDLPINYQVLAALDQTPQTSGAAAAADTAASPPQKMDPAPGASANPAAPVGMGQNNMQPGQPQMGQQPMQNAPFGQPVMAPQGQAPLPIGGGAPQGGQPGMGMGGGVTAGMPVAQGQQFGVQGGGQQQQQQQQPQQYQQAGYNQYYQQYQQQQQQQYQMQQPVFYQNQQQQQQQFGQQPQQMMQPQHQNFLPQGVPVGGPNNVPSFGNQQVMQGQMVASSYKRPAASKTSSYSKQMLPQPLPATLCLKNHRMVWCNYNPYPGSVAATCDICDRDIAVQYWFHHCQPCQADFCQKCGQQRPRG